MPTPMNTGPRKPSAPAPPQHGDRARLGHTRYGTSRFAPRRLDSSGDGEIADMIGVMVRSQSISPGYWLGTGPSVVLVARPIAD